MSDAPERVQDALEAAQRLRARHPFPTATNWHLDFDTIEAALLAAEARVREVEADVDAERRGASEIARLAEAEIATLRAERDALVPLARLGAREQELWFEKNDEMPNDQYLDALAILDREGV